MAKNRQNLKFDQNLLIGKCYKCNHDILDTNSKYCQNCSAILEPNELKWRYSFILCLLLLCLVPFLIALVSILI